jgi:hypothetical protein
MSLLLTNSGDKVLISGDFSVEKKKNFKRGQVYFCSAFVVLFKTYAILAQSWLSIQPIVGQFLFGLVVLFKTQAHLSP